MGLVVMGLGNAMRLLEQSALLSADGGFIRGNDY
jgi:hypothetical protein